MLPAKGFAYCCAVRRGACCAGVDDPEFYGVLVCHVRVKGGRGGMRGMWGKGCTGVIFIHICDGLAYCDYCLAQEQHDHFVLDHFTNLNKLVR